MHVEAGRPHQNKQRKQQRNLGIDRRRGQRSTPPIGEIARAQPSIRCENAVNRFAYEYPRTLNNATGDSANVSQFSEYAARQKDADRQKKEAHANLTESLPLGSRGSRFAGSAASKSRSTMRLNVIAAERAPTIATVIQRSVATSGTIRGQNRPRNAKGSGTACART